jgi:hypothetical protein
MTGVKRRLIAHIEIAKRAERRQVADIDKGIVWHGSSLSSTVSVRMPGGKIGGERRSAF